MGKKIDDDERGISAKGTEEEIKVELKKGPMLSRHNESGTGGSLEEKNLRKKYGTWYKWNGKSLEPTFERPSIDTRPGIVYVGIDKKTKIPMQIGGTEIGEADAARIKGALARKGVPFTEGYSLFGKKLRGFSTLGAQIGIAGGMAIIGGLIEAVQWLEFPEQIDEIKQARIDPVVVRRALDKYQVESVIRNEISRLEIVNDNFMGKNYPSNILIDADKGRLYCVVLEATDKYSLGEIVGVKALSLYDRNNYSKIFRDYEEGYTYAYFPGEGWGRFPFRQQPDE